MKSTGYTLPQIAVITPTDRLFRQWLQFNMIFGVKYIRVSTIDDIRGREFEDIVLGLQHWKVDVDVYEQAKLRIR